jgi:hypothetical protein
MSIYVDLTREFNAGRLRAILSGGQAVVLHRLAMMSKDGDWILREDDEALTHVLKVLQARGARYRFGAPLDARWMAGGWSAHFEFNCECLRARADFVTRPPRISASELSGLWREQSGKPIPFAGAKLLAQMKKTNREKDYAVIGELARLLTDVRDQMLVSRSARDLIALGLRHPELAARLADRRPVLKAVGGSREEVEAVLDAERRALMRANEARLGRYMRAAEPWAALWPAVQREIAERPLAEAHRLIVARAEGILPVNVEDMERDLSER